ncbi:hypothetical protein Sulku_0827 [Sulfuricurvum kujiense DSM 16994]|uniref:DUF945 family protein n=1 Tax=Sulfuricurvum kujiense (strain ATCC BAA-921 / DSM 16994 / JCM 11577 / YK-1) TaxID=709032 RepID=E4U1X5_SULKY|nr:hypothetical protein [Sulfuricurvum kujiense]ADR33493.1 hypothetical protein Sulku_0827 [Sulfuricurvum kujiense DSM 16994]
MDEISSVEKSVRDPFYKKYKIHLSVAAAIAAVGISALAHYKNTIVKEELISAMNHYQEELLLSGGEMKYGSVECGGIISTDCEIKAIKLSIMGQEQLSIGALRLGNVEELSELKAFASGQNIDASIDIEADDVTLPKPLLAQIISQNVSNAFQQNTLNKLDTVSFAFRGDIEGSSKNIKYLNVDQLRIDNAIMPLEFSMSARDISNTSPDTMILDHFILTMEDRAISDVTYESVKSFADSLADNEKEAFLKEFNLTLPQMSNRPKASHLINIAIAKHFETDLPNTSGMVEKDLINAMIQMLKGETNEITLEGKNQKKLTMIQLQNELQKSSAMSDVEAQKYMDDKFKLEVNSD